MIRRLPAGLAAILLALACSDPDDPPVPGAYVRHGGGQTDTVSTTFAQALVIEVITPEGPSEDVIVRFDAPTDPAAARVTVAPLTSLEDFHSSVIVPADSRGRSVVRVRLGTTVGTALLRVTVPEFGYEIDVPYTVLPGVAADILPLPQDTVVEVGASFPSRSRVIDRLGNFRSDPVALGSPSNNVTIAGNQITATASGRGTLMVSAGTLQKQMRIHVGLFAGITGLTAGRLLHFDRDGTLALDVALDRVAGQFTADWSPDGRFLIADDAGQGPLRLIAPGGQTQLRGESAPNWPVFPEFSRDGQWIYYSRSDLGWHIRRMHPDGTGDQAIAGISANHAAPSLSPDGGFLAVVNLIPDRLEVFEFATGTLREIAAPAHTPAWSPDGTKIAFVNTGTGQLEVIDPDGSNRRVISTGNRWFGLGIDWTADGLYVVGLDNFSGRLVAISPTTLSVIDYVFPGIGAPAARLQ